MNQRQISRRERDGAEEQTTCHMDGSPRTNRYRSCKDSKHHRFFTLEGYFDQQVSVYLARKKDRRDQKDLHIADAMRIVWIIYSTLRVLFLYKKRQVRKTHLNMLMPGVKCFRAWYDFLRIPHESV